MITIGEIWANLGFAFSELKKSKEALICLEEAYKRSRSNWKICENLMIISAEGKNISKLIQAINNLYLLDKFDRVKPQTFLSLVNLYLSKFNTFNDHQKNYFKTKIYEVFDKFTQKNGQSTETWDIYCSFIEYVEIKFNTEHKEEYEGLFYKKIMDNRIKQLRSIMIGNWENDEIILQRLKKHVEKVSIESTRLEKLFPEYYKEINMFLEEITSKIALFYKKKEEDIDFKIELFN